MRSCARRATRLRNTKTRSSRSLILTTRSEGAGMERHEEKLREFLKLVNEIIDDARSPHFAGRDIKIIGEVESRLEKRLEISAKEETIFLKAVRQILASKHGFEKADKLMDDITVKHAEPKNAGLFGTNEEGW